MDLRLDGFRSARFGLVEFDNVEVCTHSSGFALTRAERSDLLGTGGLVIDSRESG
jgi:hypothetical protein